MITVTLIGNLGADPALRYTPSGKAVCDLSVASNRQYTDSNGQKVKETIWTRCTTWGAQAENAAKYLKKGSKVHVVGRPIANESGNPRVFQLKDGTSSARFEITVQTITYLDRAPAGESHPAVEDGSEEFPF